MRDYIDDQHLKIREDHGYSNMLRRPLLLALVLSLVAMALFWLDSQGTLSPVRDVLTQALSPVARQFAHVHDGAANVWHDIDEMQHLREENEELRQQQSELQSQLIAREQALVENERLRQQLAIQEEQPWHLLGAEVTMRSPDAGRRVMTIGRGSEAGVAVGMAVVGQTGTGPVALVGVVEEVGTHTSSVLLTTDFGCRISARVINDGDSSLGLVQGQWQRGSRLRLDHVNYEQVLAEGAIVVSAGLTGQAGVSLPMSAVPPDVPIGEVEHLSSEEHNQYAELRPYADPDRVRYVWVILDEET
jgi:rod shape-determining protein MreC